MAPRILPSKERNRLPNSRVFIRRSGTTWVYFEIVDNRSRSVRSRIGRRQAAPYQNIGAQVGSRWPNQRAAFHAHLPKARLVVPDPGKNRTHQNWLEISLDNAAVGQCEQYTVVVY